MKRYDPEEIYRIILNNKIVEIYEDPITLKSKKKSNIYINWRNATNDIELIDKITDIIIDFTLYKGYNPDCFYGVPEGATKLGLITQYKWSKFVKNFDKNYLLPMGRGKTKDHGSEKDKYFIGRPKGKTIILEDVITTGETVLNEINKLNKYKDIEIEAIYSLTDRSGGVFDKIMKNYNINYHPLSTLEEILERLKK